MDTKKAPGGASEQALSSDAKLGIFSEIAKKKEVNLDGAADIFGCVGGLTLDTMHPSFQDYATMTADEYQVPLDWVIAAMAAATGAAAGSKIRHIGKYVNSCALWLGLVSESGDGKTPALNRAFSPLEELDREMMHEWEKDKAEWKRDKERQKVEPCPTEKNLLESECTPESLALSLCRNKNGICLYRDELSDFVSKLSTYSNNSVNAMLMWWGGKGKPIRRVTKETASMPSFIHFGIVGGVQPGVIANELASRNMQLNGFTHRWLWVNVPNMQPRTYQGGRANDDRVWREFLRNLFNSPNYDISFSKEAEKIYAQWYDEIEVERVRAKAADDHYTPELISKLEVNAIRWMIARHLLSARGGTEIQPDVAEAALLDMASFRRWGEEVGRMASGDTPRTLSQEALFVELLRKFPNMNKSMVSEALNEDKPESVRKALTRANSIIKGEK